MFQLLTFSGSSDKLPLPLREHSPVAQLAEQVAVNHWVRGSNPRGGAS